MIDFGAIGLALLGVVQLVLIIIGIVAMFCLLGGAWGYGYEYGRRKMRDKLPPETREINVFDNRGDGR